MQRKTGFTLIELLVVMAIISILAAIAIPNVQKWIQKGKATQAISEISNIELALTKILSDAGRSSLNDLFVASAVNGKATAGGGGDITTWTADQFDVAIENYTNALYALLRRGREATSVTGNFGDILNPDVVRTLGLDYMSELGNDPWGKQYKIFPGPWGRRDGPIVFRTYLGRPGGGLPGDEADPKDALTLSDATVAFVEDDLDFIGFPADERKIGYVWSVGANGISGQGRYFWNEGGYTNSPSDYFQGQEPEFMGGGDDINNWDKLQSFMRFYN